MEDFLSFPLKHGHPCDIKKAISEYALLHHGADSLEQVLKDAEEVRFKREAVVALSKAPPKVDAKSTYQRYLSALTAMESRLLVEGQPLKTLFCWSHGLFPRKTTTNRSLLFEKASVGYNLAATLSRLAEHAEYKEGISLLKASHS